MLGKEDREGIDTGLDDATRLLLLCLLRGTGLYSRIPIPSIVVYVRREEDIIARYIGCIMDPWMRPFLNIDDLLKNSNIGGSPEIISLLKNVRWEEEETVQDPGRRSYLGKIALLHESIMSYP